MEAISGGIDSLAGENSSLVSGASELQNGLSQFNSGIYSIYEGSKTLPSQIQELINGEQEFKNGISGTSKQFEGINITDNSNVKAVSFASGSHNVNSVSFVVKIPELKIKKDEPPQIATQNNKSFWDRFLDLFR